MLTLSVQTTATLDRHFVVRGEVQSVHKQVEALNKRVAGDAGKAMVAKQLTDFNAKLTPLLSGEGEDALNLGAMGDALNTLQVDLEGSDRAPSQPQREVLAQYSARLERALAAWSAIKTSELPALNAALKAAGLGAIKVPARAEIPAIDSGLSKEMP